MRGRFVDLDEMEQETVESIPEFIVLITSLLKAGLADVVYHIICGVPAYYQFFLDVTVGRSGEKLIEAVNKSHFNLLVDSIKLKLSALNSHPTVSKLCDFYKTEKAVSDVRVDVVTRSSTDKTLRVIKVEGGRFLAPSTRAMAFILHNNCANAHSVAQIREVLKCQLDKSNIDKQQLMLQ